MNEIEREREKERGKELGGMKERESGWESLGCTRRRYWRD